MADVFLMRGDVESGLSFFDKVVDIWYKFLIGIRHKKNELIRYVSYFECELICLFHSPFLPCKSLIIYTIINNINNIINN